MKLLLTILAILAVVAAVNAKWLHNKRNYGCSGFRCNDGECIPSSWKCDDEADCDDSSDESGCGGSSSCSSSQFQCGNGNCIPSSWTCDSDNDCGDSSDESGCGGSSSCSSSQFQCGNGNCIPSSWTCDSDNDCGDSSDESGCGGASSCSSSQFECGNGNCIPSNWKCDSDNDCGDNSDESSCGGGGSSPSRPPSSSTNSCEAYNLPSYHSLCYSKGPNFVRIIQIDQAAVLERHNYWRRRVQPPARTPLPDLVWDDDLAQEAENWAARCTEGHDKHANRSLPDRGSRGPAFDYWVGQNVFYGPNLTQGVDVFAAELKDWQYGVGSINGNVVGHYTQVVWENTTHVGCGGAQCTENTFYGEWSAMTVCNYGPGGNYDFNPWKENKARPYKI